MTAIKKNKMRGYRLVKDSILGREVRDSLCDDVTLGQT